ncbi:MAG: chromosomal replication initiator protein DnaA [Gemmatimonadetes bacterium]|nr:chromosomal replication initiator protein DnaA [Gemmatimonadota bacterium]NNM05776.1 chromosomal replication initiator protein DnaA [Gemmatimonadota bacterium]
MELTASELWSRILQVVQTGLPEQAFTTWLARTHPVALSDQELLIEAPSQFHVEWLEDKYGPLLEEAASKIAGRHLSLSFSAGDSPSAPPVPTVELTSPDPADRRSAGPQKSDQADSAGPGLNRRYSFDRFVVGGDNQLAAAACSAVAEKPARMYNPLFLYGGVGLGKTHLMHAIGNAILEETPSKRVAYVPSEQFTNELVTSIQKGAMPEFRRRYRRMDLLLVDDVHFLEGKERTQEEFFHTFNALYDAHKQIVLTSDRPPKEIPGLEERLISRFEWGLVADIKAPDYETRVAILRKKAADDNLTLDTEVIDFIAQSCTSSVRELEGAVIKLLAYSSLKNLEITVSLAKAALQGVLGSRALERSSKLTPDSIKAAVAHQWGVEAEDLSSKRRTKDLTVPRQVAMYLIREFLELPLVRIGSHFGGRDHSTVIHSIRKVEETAATEPAFQRKVAALREELSRLV